MILFGLSMDYHVFILSRVKELVDGGMSTEEAVAAGIKRTAGTVTSAAVVMVAVFAIFVTLRTLDIKQMGFGLAAAILIDSTVVRAVLLPSVMKLLGDWNWYLPRWLEWLPQLNGASEHRSARPSAGTPGGGLSGARLQVICDAKGIDDGGAAGVDSDRGVRRGVCSSWTTIRASAAPPETLLTAEGFDVVAEAHDGASALAAAAELAPEIVLLDIQLPDMDGFEVARRLRELQPEIRIVLVSSRERCHYGPMIEASGACGFVCKDELSGALLERPADMFSLDP